MPASRHCLRHSHARGESVRIEAQGWWIAGSACGALDSRHAGYNSCSQVGPLQPNWHMHMPVCSSQTPCQPHETVQRFPTLSGTAGTSSPTRLRPTSGSKPITFIRPSAERARCARDIGSRTAGAAQRSAWRSLSCRDSVEAADDKIIYSVLFTFPTYRPVGFCTSYWKSFGLRSPNSPSVYLSVTVPAPGSGMRRPCLSTAAALAWPARRP